jgi:hypothetical protein
MRQTQRQTPTTGVRLDQHSMATDTFIVSRRNSPSKPVAGVRRAAERSAAPAGRGSRVLSVGGSTTGSSLSRRPSCEWPADLPFVAEGIDEAAYSPAVLVGDPRFYFGANRDGSGDHGVGVVDHEQQPGGRTAEDARYESVHALPGRGDPERCVIDGQLGDEVLAFADEVEYPGADTIDHNTIVQLWACNNTTQQEWREIRYSNGSTSLVNRRNGKVLDSGPNGNGTPVILFNPPLNPPDAEAQWNVTLLY